MTETVEDLGGGAGAIGLGASLDLPAQLPIAVTIDDATYLRAGYVETDTSKFDTAFWPKIWRLTDNLIPFGAQSLALNTDTGTLITVTASNRIYRSTDGGNNFTEVANITGMNVHIGSLRYGNGVFMFGARAGQSGAGYYRSADDGQTWTKMGTQIIHSDVEWCGGDIWLGGNGNTVSQLSYIYRSTDNGATFQTVNLGFSGLKFGRRIIAKPTDRNIVVLASDDKTIRSTDAGLTWSVVDDAAANALNTDGAGIWLKAMNASLKRSTDDGQTWQGLTPNIAVNTSGYMYFDSETGAWITGNYVSFDAGDTWSQTLGDFVQSGSLVQQFTIPMSEYGASGVSAFVRAHVAGGLEDSRQDALCRYVRIA